MLAVASVATTYAQDDVSVTLNNYTSGEATSDDPLDMVFTITNEGAAAIPTGDTIFFAFVVGTNNYSMNLTAGAVSYVILTADMNAGDQLDLSMLSTPPSTMDMQWLYEEMGGLTGNVCAFAGVSQASLSLTPGADANYVDNTMCVSYTVTEVAGAEEVGMSHFSVYPNPANTFVQFKVGNNDVTHVDIFDVTGKLITTVLLNNSIEEVNVENFENGVYFYRIMNDEAVVKSDKFVVQK